MAGAKRRGPRIGQALTGAALRAGISLLRLLPVGAASATGGWVGRTVGPRLRVSRRAYENLRLILPERGAEAHRAIVKEMWDNLGRVVAEYPYLKRFIEPELLELVRSVTPADAEAAAARGEQVVVKGRRIELEGAEQFLDLLQNPGPRIFFSGHFGNWEISPLAVQALGLEMNVMYRAPNNPVVDREIARLRGRHAGLVPKGYAGARLAHDTLGRGLLLGLLADQKHNQGVAIPFLGRPAMTATMIARLALKYGCPVHGATVERLGGARFRVILKPPLEFELSGDRKADVDAILTAVNACFGDWIREKPGQWLWLHRRWPPSGELESVPPEEPATAVADNG